jgi:hypothetical protein
MTDVSFNQLNCVTPLREEVCGETCDADVASDYGFAWTPDQVVSWMQSQGWNLSPGSSLQEHAAFFAHLHIATQFIPFEAIAAAANAGNHVIVLIHDDANADPSSGGDFHHFIVVVAVSGNEEQDRNPWGGRFIDYPNSQVESAFIGAMAVIRPAQATATTPGAQQQEDDAMQRHDITYQWGRWDGLHLDNAGNLYHDWQSAGVFMNNEELVNNNLAPGQKPLPPLVAVRWAQPPVPAIQLMGIGLDAEGVEHQFCSFKESMGSYEPGHWYCT